jgi:hypothetical protein
MMILRSSPSPISFSLPVRPTIPPPPPLEIEFHLPVGQPRKF